MAAQRGREKGFFFIRESRLLCRNRLLTYIDAAAALDLAAETLFLNRRLSLRRLLLGDWRAGGEALDECPYALFVTAARKSLGSCELGDTVKAGPKQFR